MSIIRMEELKKNHGMLLNLLNAPILWAIYEAEKCYKQGAWQKRGMSKLVVKINSSDVQSG